MTVRYKVRRESLKKCEQATRALIEHVTQSEPRTLLYMVHQEMVDRTQFQHIIVFENEAAMIIHRNSKAAEHFSSTVYPETVAPI
ncbi:MAG: putative quinol monooxygenase, partial [Desulfobacterales bacterium]